MDLDKAVELLRNDPVFDDLLDVDIRLALSRNPNWPEEFRRLHAERERKRERFNASLTAVLLPLSIELEAAGLLERNDGTRLGIVAEERTNEAFPLLIKWYPRIKDEHARDYISFAFYRPEAANWIPELIDLFRSLRGDDEIYATARIGASATYYGKADYVDEYVEFASDSVYGRNRRHFVIELWKYRKDRRVLPLLINIVNNDADLIMVQEALYALRRIGDPSTRYLFERYLENESTNVRKIAKEGIAKVDNAIARREGRAIPPKRLKKRAPKPLRPWPHDLPHNALVSLMLTDLLKLEDLAALSERELLEFPGIGPATIKRINIELKDQGLPPLTD